MATYIRQAYYDRRADVPSVATRKDKPKHVFVGRGAFAAFADEDGID